MIVQITQSDIDVGRRGPYSCPAALAIRRTLGLGYGDVSVSKRWVTIAEVPHCTPVQLAGWIMAFDAGESVVSIEFELPVTDELARGTHAGFQWLVKRNPLGFRCGYMRVPREHPWYGRCKINVRVHGGITCAELDDDGYWLGFDCGHPWDLPDPTLLPFGRPPEERRGLRLAAVRTQEYVEAECRSLCEQASAAAAAAAGGTDDMPL